MIGDAEWQAINLSLRLALCTTLVLLIIAVPLGWWLSQTKSSLKVIIEAIVTLPLVLPPTVLGFYLLILFAPQSPFGGWWLSLTGKPLVFDFYGLLMGSVLYSLPFVVQPIRDGFMAVRQEWLDVCHVMGASQWQRFRYLLLPLNKQAMLTAAIMGFAHTMGEFGVVLLIGGNIPGETRVISIALYDLIETMQYEQANWLAGGLLVMSFAVLALVSLLQKSHARAYLKG